MVSSMAQRDHVELENDRKTCSIFYRNLNRDLGNDELASVNIVIIIIISFVQ